jgi:hypothetical protein
LFEGARKMKVAHAHFPSDSAERNTSFLFVGQMMIDQGDRFS